MTPKSTHALYAVALAAGILMLYAFGLNNQLVFDDGRLTDGTIFAQYGSLLHLKTRLVSYGSFVWVQNILGENWPGQRLFNTGLHIATALALYALVLALLERASWGDGQKSQPNFASSLPGAARAGVALWAFNPVAVYAVAYLIQRSILMATLFVVLACLGFVRGLVSGRPGWFVAAFVCYLLGVAAKEHAVTAILLTVPLFVFIKRPSILRVMAAISLAATLLVAVGAVLYSQYGAVVGAVFDETSRAFALQLEQQQPGIRQHLYLLSIVHQAGLFFKYGLMWLVPYVGWMSIDIRPAFPLTLISASLIGGVAWLCLLLGSAWLVLRRGDVWGLVGLGLLMPCLLFVTEFATVWLQDPFVLYRSYLWSMALPLLLALPLVGISNRKVDALVLILVGVLAAFSFERIHSLRSPAVAWLDAADKIDLQAPASAVGRWRPFLNLGAEKLEASLFQDALHLFTQAETLGEPLGSARFNMGVSLQQLNQHPLALDNFAKAEAKGFTEAALYFQRGESQYALGQFAPAYASFTQALARPQTEEATEFTRMRQAESAQASTNYDAAISAYRILIQINPGKQRYKVGLSMAYLRKNDFGAALDILNPELAERPTGPAYYARALTHYAMGKHLASAQDLAMALQTDDNNPAYLQLQQLLAQPSAATQPATKP
ncbi:tetratricopeptide repeat protein [Rhodoferax sp.]|uniref:tetratricopeptide repeat protein n=1 Tax=Rhodoferax sp. TaxID=50421 RepID=UPI002617885A|nr:tetratricopeptide repeat protein [Rhodoferax sp.]MDD2919819.1 tetratricopeptide repeat protein [Rhodoferax sp.]